MGAKRGEKTWLDAHKRGKAGQNDVVIFVMMSENQAQREGLFSCLWMCGAHPIYFTIKLQVKFEHSNCN